MYSIRNIFANKITKKQKLALTLLACTCVFQQINIRVEAGSKWEQFAQQAEKAYQSGRLPEAEQNFVAALKEAEKFDKTDKRLATTLYNLALVYVGENKYSEAESTFLRALEVIEQIYGQEHERAAQVYLDLGDLYVQEIDEENKDEMRKKAAENYQKAVDIYEKVYAKATGQKPEDKKDLAEKNEPDEQKPQSQDQSASAGSNKAKTETKPLSSTEAAKSLADALRIFADFYAGDDEFEPAEPLYKRSLELEEYATGGENKDFAKHKAHVAEYYCVQGKYAPAEPLFKDALAIAQKMNAADSIETANIMYNYAGLHYDQGHFAEAEKLFKSAIKIFEQSTEQDEADIAMKNVALADVLDMQGKTAESASLYKKCIAVLEKSSQQNGYIQCLKQYQKHLLMQDDKEGAAKIAARIKEVKAAQAKQ